MNTKQIDMNKETTSDHDSALTETLHIMSVPGLADSIIKASKEPRDECAEEIDL